VLNSDATLLCGCCERAGLLRSWVLREKVLSIEVAYNNDHEIKELQTKEAFVFLKATA
jgi:hypothetical protein